MLGCGHTARADGSVLVRSVTAGSDSVDGYFGMREVKLGKDSGGSTRPMINGKFRFLAGFLDQSWWPDGQVRFNSILIPF